MKAKEELLEPKNIRVASMRLLIGAAIALTISCGKKMSFEDQIRRDVYEKIASGYCDKDDIPKGSEIKNLKIGEITPIGETGMIDVSLEFDIEGADGTDQHITEAMLYLKSGNRQKMLAIFCDYDYRKKK